MTLALGMVRPGSTIFVPFNTFDSNDPSASVAIAAFIAGDIEIYKDGSVTQRASTNGYTLLDTDGIDFDGHVGIGGFSIDLADNSTAGFYVAGSRYFIVVGPTTVDAAVVNFVAATFEIGMPNAVWNTGIASLTSATQFILDKGPAEASVLIGSPVYIHDVASEVQFAYGVVKTYAVTTKEVVLEATPVGFTPAAADNVSFFMPDNIHSISGDIGAADNVEATYDGTGYADDQAPATQSQLGGIQSAGSAVHQLASSYVLTTGTQSSGTVSSTEALDGTNHEHTDVGNAMELYYEFLIGAGLPEAVEITGYLNSANDDLDVYGFDWVASAWVQIGNLAGKAQSTNDVHIFNMFINMVGSGADEGKVRVRFQKASGLSTATLAIDQIFVAFALGASSYANGAIWINTSLSNTNTVPGIDGTERNPVSTIAAALTLSASTNLDKFQISPGSTITLAAAFTSKEMDGQEWTLALGGQDISGSGFVGATITGIGTGTGPRFTHCDMGAVTLPADSHVINCGLEGDQTFGAAGDFFYDKCYSRLANDAAVVFDFGAALNASSLSVRHQSGGVEVQNMGAGTGSYLMSLEGFGQLIINANCSATSAISIRGTFTLTDNAGGAVTLTDDARIDMPQINAEADTALSDYDGPTEAEMDTAHALLATEAKQDIIDGIVDAILVDTADMQPLIEKMAYVGSHGLGVWIDDGAANTNTVLGTDGTPDNPVSTIAAATTIATALGSQRFYLVNDTQIILAATYEGYEFVGIGEMSSNRITLGTQDVDNSIFHNLLLTGAQGGTGRCQAEDCVLQTITGMEITALRCLLANAGSLTLRNDCAFDSCFSAVAGAATPTLNINSVANVNVYFRHYSGGLQIDNAVSTTVMSYESDGQLIIDATCTSLTIVVRGNCSITDNGTTTSLTQDAAVNRTNINAEADQALADYDAPTKAEMDTAHALLATPTQVLTQVNAGWTTQMPDAVAADGAIATRQQAMYEILQFLTEFDWVGTTLTIRKVDGTTQLMVFTADDATDPTTITRTT